MPQRNGNEQTTPRASRSQRAGHPATEPREGAQDQRPTEGRQAGFQQIGRLISENPVPVGMIWIGAGWLALRQLSRGRPAQGSQPLEAAKARVGTAGESVGQAVSATQDAVSRLLGGVEHFVATIGEQAPRAAEQAVGTAGSQAARAQTAIGGLLEEKPLAVTAAAMAGGAALGLIAPTTRTEAETLAEPTKGLVTKAESLVSETMDTLEQAVGQPTSAPAASKRTQRRTTTTG
jgi:hypothetical protein